jgi:hypothetical protein
MIWNWNCRVGSLGNVNNALTNVPLFLFLGHGFGS